MVWACCKAVVGRRTDDEQGASIVEYAFLVSLIAVFCIGAMMAVGGATVESLSETASRIP